MCVLQQCSLPFALKYLYARPAHFDAWTKQGDPQNTSWTSMLKLPHACTSMIDNQLRCSTNGTCTSAPRSLFLLENALLLASVRGANVLRQAQTANANHTGTHTCKHSRTHVVPLSQCALQAEARVHATTVLTCACRFLHTYLPHPCTLVHTRVCTRSFAEQQTTYTLTPARPL